MMKKLSSMSMNQNTKLVRITWAALIWLIEIHFMYT